MGTKTKFTRGTWAIQDGGYGMIGVVFRKGFGVLVGIKDSETVANAHLIAAAPELYKALEDLLYYAEDYSPRHYTMAVENAEKALAKARGEIE